jgi:hypothetical protein
MAEFRSDIDAFVSRDVVEAAVVPGRHELPPMLGVNYTAYMDPSGGSGADAMTIAVAHNEKGCGILDAARERRPPFSPEAVVSEFAELLKSYRVRKVTGDHWGGEFVREPFRSNGIEYVVCDKTASDTYRDTLPLLNSGKVELLDLPRLLKQLCNLDRRTARSGKDSISHPPGQHDDLANAVCGALLLAGSRKAPLVFSDAVLAWSEQPERGGRPIQTCFR